MGEIDVHGSITVLRQIQDLSEKVLGALSRSADFGSPLQTRASPLPFSLSLHSLESLQNRLLQLGISIGTIRTLSTVFKRSFQEYEGHLREVWAQVANELQRSESTIRSIGLFKACLEQQRLVHCSKLEEAIIYTVKQRVDSYTKDANAASESQSVSEEDNCSRGHSKLAVAILEKAYAHTTNITRAEKFKLAEATGLQPRQVTIWFQNRRNRRVAACKDDNFDNTSQRHLSARVTSPVSTADTHANDTPRSTSLSYTIDSSPSLHAMDSDGKLCSPGGYSTAETSFDGSNDSRYDFGTRIRKRCSLDNTSFDDEVHQQLHSNKFWDASPAFIFDSNGILRLDIDDLQLDLRALEAELSFSPEIVQDLTLPPTASQAATLSQDDHFNNHGSMLDKAPAATNQAALSVAEGLAEANFTANCEIARIRHQEDWNCTMKDIVHNAGSEEETPSMSDFITIGSASSGNRTPNSDGINMDGLKSSMTADAFDFTLSGLGIEQIVEQSYFTFTSEREIFETSAGYGPMLCQDDLNSPFTPT